MTGGSAGLHPREEFGPTSSKTVDDPVKRVDSEIPIPFFYIGKIASVEPCHKGKLLLRNALLPAKLFYPPSNIVSHFRLFHTESLFPML